MSKDLAKDYFERHSSNECHITSDDRVFHDIGSAQSFASSLDDQKITSYTRKEIETPVINLNDAVIQFDPATADYKEAKALVLALGLETLSNKKEDVFAAIVAYKETLDLEVN